MNDKSRFDICVVGGGMVGAATALAMADLGLTVAVIENRAPTAYSINDELDLRVSAISLGSQNLFSELNVWQALTQMRHTPYKKLAVWEQAFAKTEFDCEQIGQTHLGHIIENRVVQLSLWSRLTEHENITLYCPESLSHYRQEQTGVEIVLSQSEINAKLLLAADGANSQVRQLSGIGTTGWQYAQSAMLINVKLLDEQSQIENQAITWQQFTENGPVALLPLPNGHASLVWYHQSREIKRLQSLSNEALAHEIKANFPKQLGDIEVMSKGAFALTRRHANRYVQNRVVLLGDAAHTINPLAGQGVNLGFKDVAGLKQVISDAIDNGEAFDSESVLMRYQRKRYNDNLLMMTTMDALYATFSNDVAPLKLLRNLGLYVAHRAPIIKDKALAYACGI